MFRLSPNLTWTAAREGSLIPRRLRIAGNRRVAGAAILAVLVTLACSRLGMGQTLQPGTVQLGWADPDPAGYSTASALGVRWARITADWSAIESQRGQPTWADLDRAVAAAQRGGLTPMLVLVHTPRWASMAAGADLQRPEIYARQPPQDLREWDRFVGSVAARYRDRVRDWQIWNQLGLPHFRGTANEYVAMLQTAAMRLRALDSSARIVAASPEGVDLAFCVRMLQVAPGHFDTLALTPRGLAPESLLRPLGILTGRARAAGKTLWMEWTQDQSGDADTRTGLLARALAVAQATGVERFFIRGLRPGDADLRTVTSLLAGRPHSGYLARDPDVFAVLYGVGADAVLLAWAIADRRTLELPQPTDARVLTIAGRPAIAEARDSRTVLHLTHSPLIVTGVAQALLDEARATAMARGALLPVVPPERDFSRSPEVSARLGLVGEERGLYNLPYRNRPNGAVEPFQTALGEGVRTVIARGVIYVYFDIADTFAFFLEGRTPLEITVEVWGSQTQGQVGFNLLYDSTSGYRFTPWQWVEVADGWVLHTFHLTDASMANTWGWDFAINAGGNRAGDLIVRRVTVRKVLPP